MREFVATAIIATVALLSACDGGDTPQTIHQDIVANLKEMAAILNSIKDEDTAKAAVPRITALRAKMKDVGNRAKAMPKLSESEVKAFDLAAAKDMAELEKLIGPAQEKLDALMIANPEIKKILEPAFEGRENDL